jgi:hypothetical protein
MQDYAQQVKEQSDLARMTQLFVDYNQLFEKAVTQLTSLGHSLDDTTQPSPDENGEKVPSKYRQGYLLSLQTSLDEYYKKLLWLEGVISKLNRII